MKKAIKLIEDANEELMKLRIKSLRHHITEDELYDIQMLLYKALDILKPIGSYCPTHPETALDADGECELCRVSAINEE